MEQVRAGATMSDALRSVGVSHRALKTWLTEDAYFVHVYGYAQEERTDQVERAARDLAVNGQKYIVASGGHAVGENVVRSERMIEMLLKAERPSKFGDRRHVEITGNLEFSKPEVTVILAQVRQVLRGSIDIPALPSANAGSAAHAVIDAVVVDAAEGGLDEEAAVVAQPSEAEEEE